jgi:glycolate oxidase FAD binding subunit
LTGSELSSPQLVEHEPGDLTAIVEAAMGLDELQLLLARHGQRLSLDPPGAPTLGECLLEDLSGPLRHRFGTMRDLVLGVTVVLRDGLRANSGGKVVKNVAGYDLAKLFCGSRGRLGSVERLALRLHPLPMSARTVAIDGGRWPWLHHSQLVPSAVDIAEGRLHVLIEGSQRSVERQLAELGGEECDPWATLRELQATLPGRRRWDELDGDAAAPLVRPGPRVAYTTQAPPEQWSPLAERIVEAMWTPS